MAEDDYEVLKALFPEIVDWFHINGKFVLVPPFLYGEWVVGEERRVKLTELGFQWEIRGSQIWIQDR